MSTYQDLECTSCGNTTKFQVDNGIPDSPVCKVCLSLGDRALVPLLRDPSPERLARFYASPPGSVLFDASLMRRGKPQYGSWVPFEEDPRHKG